MVGCRSSSGRDGLKRGSATGSAKRHSGPRERRGLGHEGGGPCCGSVAIIGCGRACGTCGTLNVNVGQKGPYVVLVLWITEYRGGAVRGSGELSEGVGLWETHGGAKPKVAASLLRQQVYSSVYARGRVSFSSCIFKSSRTIAAVSWMPSSSTIDSHTELFGVDQSRRTSLTHTQPPPTHAPRLTLQVRLSDGKWSDTVFSTVPLKSQWCAFHVVQRHKHTCISLFTESHTMDITHFLEKMYDAAVRQIAHRVVRQDIPAHVHHSDVSGQPGFEYWNGTLFPLPPPSLLPHTRTPTHPVTHSDIHPDTHAHPRNQDTPTHTHTHPHNTPTRTHTHRTHTLAQVCNHISFANAGSGPLHVDCHEV